MVVTANSWNGSFNGGEFGLTGAQIGEQAEVVNPPITSMPLENTSCPVVMELGNVGSGIAATDTAQGVGWLMWSEVDVHSRFNPTPHVRAANHVIAVVYEGGSWQVDSESVLTPFT